MFLFLQKNKKLTWGGTGPTADERFLGTSEWINDTGSGANSTGTGGSQSVAGSNATGSSSSNTNNHSVSQPIPMQRRPGGGNNGNDVSAVVNHDPSTNAGLLSPRSAENLHLKLVNYILDDNSPSVKEIETRVKSIKLGKGSGSSGVGSGGGGVGGGGVNASGVGDSQDNDAASTDSTSSSNKAESGKSGRGSSKQSMGGAGNMPQQQQSSLGDQSNVPNQQGVSSFYSLI